MKQFLKIQLLKDDEIFATCEYIHLDSFAPTSARRFVFKNVLSNKNILIGYGDVIKIRVMCARKDARTKTLFSEFNVTILDTAAQIEKEWWIYGLITHFSLEEYSQGAIDIFYQWQHESIIEWDTFSGSG
ncbi:MAG: hypothetical protein RL757_2005 [Bacteroidota bacterium]